MSKTSIQWTEESWNPIVGCSILTPGCTNCYAMKMAARVEAMNAEARAAAKKVGAPQYDGTTKSVNGKAVWTGKLSLAENILLNPLKRKKSTTYFVNSMGDLFHEDIPFEWIRRVFGIMSRCPQHTFQILTKRAARMREVVQRMIDHPSDGVAISPGNVPDLPIRLRRIGSDGVHVVEPLPNVWLGVSTERQQEADERIPHLLATPAAVRFISAEPLLGPIELWNMDEGVLRGCAVVRDGHMTPSTPHNPPEGVDTSYPGIDWVIVGGESGPGSRPMHPDWARSLRNQCSAAGVPFFFKQWGNWAPHLGRLTDFSPGARDATRDQTTHYHHFVSPDGKREATVYEIGKKCAGRALDGIEYNEMPEVPR